MHIAQSSLIRMYIAQRFSSPALISISTVYASNFSSVVLLIACVEGSAQVTTNQLTSFDSNSLYQQADIICERACCMFIVKTNYPQVCYKLFQ